jgi:hypothetical protein
MPKQSTLTVKPPMEEAKLMNNISNETVGAGNYLAKQNFRREYNNEARREGDIYFTNCGGIPDAYPDALGGEAIDLIHFAQAPNGQVVLLAFTRSSIYRYYGSINGIIYDDVYDDDVFEDRICDWVNVNPFGYVFSPDGHRWEAETVNGITFVNNGVDLPHSYCAWEGRFQPVYQLREVCVSRVETIEQINGIILCMGITTIDKTKFKEWMNGETPYGLYSDSTEQTRQWRILAGTIGDPRIWNGTGYARITAGGTDLIFETPMESINVGDEIYIEGAGPSGSNLLATVSDKLDNKNFLIDTQASTTVAHRQVHRCENLDSAPSPTFYDLVDDGSAIIRGKTLGTEQIIIYKDTGHWLGTYTGNPDNPFTFTHKYRGRKTIHYRWSLEEIHTDGGVMHVYAGKNAFYNCTGGEPAEPAKLILCKDLFFQNIMDRESAYAANNEVSEEYWLRFSSHREDINILMWSYRWDDVSYSDYGYTTFANVRTETNTILGESQDRFLCGTIDGAILIYGLSDEREPLFNDRYSFFGRRGRLTTTSITLVKEGDYIRASAPFFLSDDLGKYLYLSRDENHEAFTEITRVFSNTLIEVADMIATDEPLSGGVFEGFINTDITDGYEGFKARNSRSDQEDEIEMYQLTLLMGSKDRGAPMQVELFGAKNPSDEILLTEQPLFNRTIDDPRKNTIPTFRRKNYFQTRISVKNSLLDARFLGKIYRYKRVIGSDRLTSARR